MSNNSINGFLPSFAQAFGAHPPVPPTLSIAINPMNFYGNVYYLSYINQAPQISPVSMVAKQNLPVFPLPQPSSLKPSEKKDVSEQRVSHICRSVKASFTTAQNAVNKQEKKRKLEQILSIINKELAIPNISASNKFELQLIKAEIGVYIYENPIFELLELLPINELYQLRNDLKYTLTLAERERGIHLVDKTRNFKALSEKIDKIQYIPEEPSIKDSEFMSLVDDFKESDRIFVFDEFKEGVSSKPSKQRRNREPSSACVLELMKARMNYTRGINANFPATAIDKFDSVLKGVKRGLKNLEIDKDPEVKYDFKLQEAKVKLYYLEHPEIRILTNFTVSELRERVSVLKIDIDGFVKSQQGLAKSSRYIRMLPEIQDLSKRLRAIQNPVAEPQGAKRKREEDGDDIDSQRPMKKSREDI